MYVETFIVNVNKCLKQHIYIVNRVKDFGLSLLDDWQLCLVHVNSLFTHLQLKKMSVIYQSSHVAITFQLLEMSSITTPNQTILNTRTRYKYFKEKYHPFYQSE